MVEPGAWAEAAGALERAWATDPRWRGVRRDYTARDVVRLRGSVAVEQTLARHGAERLWALLHAPGFVPALGALTGVQAVQMVRAGLPAIYVSGWQVAADQNGAGQMYPDLGLYPCDSVPALVRAINNALRRADQIAWAEGRADGRWLVPVVADAEAGFGGPLNAFELTKALVEAGAAALHLEDQLSAERRCGHLGGKVLVPTAHQLRVLRAARLAADVLGVPTLLIARTDALGAPYLTSAIDEGDQAFLTGERTPEGYFVVRPGLEAALHRGLAYAPYADLLWFETPGPDLDEARAFAEGVAARFPGKPLAYNLSPSFRWRRHLEGPALARFTEALADLGYRFQFVTVAGFHALAAATFALAHGFRTEGMAAYAGLQDREAALAKLGYTALRHQAEVGTAYYDEVARLVAAGRGAPAALRGSTEEEQFR